MCVPRMGALVLVGGNEQDPSPSYMPALKYPFLYLKELYYHGSLHEGWLMFLFGSLLDAVCELAH